MTTHLMNGDGKTATACEKVRHGSAIDALSAITTMVRNGKHEPERGPLSYYHCPDCGGYHVGHDRELKTTVVPAARERAALRSAVATEAKARTSRKSRAAVEAADVSLDEMGGIATYAFEFVGKSPLLMHRDNIAVNQLIKDWQDDPKNAKSSVRGDDRSPAWAWQASLYEADSRVSIPNQVVMTAFRKAGAMVRVPGGRNGKTFKDTTQYGMLPLDDNYDLLIDGEPIDLAPVVEVWGVNDFDKQVEVARSLGFDLFVVRARVGQSKHVRVRPIFKRWSLRGRVDVTEAAITEDVLKQITGYAGARVGIGDWRPGSPSSPGTYGRFDVRIERIA